MAEFDDLFYSKWVQKYREISGNQNPPTKYKEWIRLAASLGVSTDPNDYRQIFEHLQPYKQKTLTIDLLAKIARKINSYGTRVNGQQMNSFMQTLNNWPFHSSLVYLPEVLDPNINFYAITHIYDEGIVAPADDDQEKRYAGMDDLFKRSKAVREALGEYKDSHMLLSAPASFVAVPFDAPVFSVNRLRGFKDIILPTFRTGLPASMRDMDTALNAPAWENKEKRAVFRGRTTGMNFPTALRRNIPFTRNPRFKLHEMSLLQKQGKLKTTVELDFGITELWQCDADEAVKSEILHQFPLVPPLNYSEQFRSKYLVIVDGNGWPDRVANFMLSGSLVFLATLHDEWVINQLIDGENYIKVKPDLSDLIEKLEWAADNDAEAKRIALNGREFAKNKFGLSQMQMYNALLFMEYQQLFQ